MRNRNKLQRAAMVALVAGALVVGAGPASAGVYRFPESGPSRLPVGRAKIADDGSGGLLARVRVMLASVHLFPEGIGPRISRFPAWVQRHSD
jgi:hypothetical protein